MSRQHHRLGLVIAAVIIGSCLTYNLVRPTAPPGVEPRVNFSLRGVDGKSITFPDVVGKVGVVLIFLGNSCPNSNKVLPRLVELATTYESKGISFLGVNSNASETSQDVAAHAKEHGISFPVCKDRHNILADLVGVKRTCEVVMLDAGGFVRYHGAIDDQFGRGTSKPVPTHHYLADALDAILAGRQVQLAATTAIGCPIDRIKPRTTPARVRPAPLAIVQTLEDREKSARPLPVGPLNYATDVAPIVQRKCQSCHRPGQEAPFPLISSDDVQSRVAGIAEVVEERRMPPWHADPRFGHFRNDRSLTARERTTILAWIEQGSPPGDPAQLPPPRSFPDGWSIGAPDVVFEIPKPNDVPPIGVLDYVIVTVPTQFDRDMWVQAAEIRPEVRSVVHHIIVQILGPNASQRTQGEHLATYVPGDAPTIYTSGIAKLIPAGSQLKFGIHYTPDGIARTDRSKIGLVFAQAPVQHRAFTRSVENTKFAIPPHSAAYQVTSTYTTPSDIHLLSFSPHMHVRGKDFQYTATYPAGRCETLLSVPSYDFGWQSTYLLAEAKAIPQGTRIDCVAHFDNSAANAANPDPSQRVEWGEQSFQEMMIGYFDYVVDSPTDRKVSAASAEPAKITRR